MKLPALLSQPGALSIAFLVLTAVSIPSRAQVAPETPPTNSPAPEQLNQTELLKAYLQVREQLHTAQLAMVSSRVEAATEKLETLRKALEVERERQQAELQRAAALAERQQAEAERSNRATVWAAAAFGAAGLLAMLMIPFVQARAMKRMAHLVTTQPLQTPTSSELLPAPAAAADQAVSGTTERLLTMVERMEKRIKELETTATPPPPAMVTSGGATPANTVRLASGGELAPRTSAEDRAMWIAVLMNKAQTLLNSAKPQEAVACYNEILSYDPSHAQALVRKGAALEKLNRFEEALECYDLAIEADNRMTLAHLSKGGMCNRLGRHNEAIQSYERALQVEARAI